MRKPHTDVMISASILSMQIAWVFYQLLIAVADVFHLQHLGLQCNTAGTMLKDHQAMGDSFHKADRVGNFFNKFLYISQKEARITGFTAIK